MSLRLSQFLKEMPVPRVSLFSSGTSGGAPAAGPSLCSIEKEGRSPKKTPRVTYSIAFTFTYVSSRLSLSLLKYPSNVPNSTPSPLTTSQSTSPSIPAKLL